MNNIGKEPTCQECGACLTESYQMSGNVKEDIIKSVVENVLKRIASETDIQILSIPEDYNIPLGISVRHIHITQPDLEVLFGTGTKLEVLRELRQPGEFASKLTCTVAGPQKAAIEKIRILGPCRDFTQVELSNTDAIVLGLDIPTKASGDIKGSAPITLIGPKGTLNLKEGAIRAQRHIHFTPEAASYHGVKDKEFVKVRVTGDTPVIFENVLIRVKKTFLPEFHLDTDEANAVGVRCGTQIEIIK